MRLLIYTGSYALWSSQLLLAIIFDLGKKKGLESCFFKGAWQEPGRKSCVCRDVSGSPEQLWKESVPTSVLYQDWLQTMFSVLPFNCTNDCSVTQLTAPVLLARLSPLKGTRQLSVTINTPAMLQACSGFHDVSLQTQSWCWPPSWLSWTCLPTVLPLPGSMSYIPFLRGRWRVKLFSLFWRKIVTIYEETEPTRNQFITSEKRLSQ